MVVVDVVVLVEVEVVVVGFVVVVVLFVVVTGLGFSICLKIIYVASVINYSFVIFLTIIDTCRYAVPLQ